MDGHSSQHQVSFRWLAGEGFAHGGFGPQLLGKSVGYVGERVPGAAGYDELAFAEQRFRLVPLSYVVECVDANQEEKAVYLPERLSQLSHRIDGVIGTRR